MQRTSITATVLTCLLFSCWSGIAAAQEPPAPPPEDVVDDDVAPDEEPSQKAPPESPPPPQAPNGEEQPEAAPPAAKSEEPSEEMAVDDAELMDGESPARPPAKGKGAIWGTIKDAVEKEPLPEATVTAVGTKYKTVADYEGHYRLELPPGTYTLRFFFELHRPALVKDVVVKAGRVEQVDSDVLPDEAAVETFEVETQADTASVEGQVLARQRSATVGDGVGRSEISKTPASNAAQAAQRVVGATIVGSRFVYVRGLGERYTNALLNDAPLPSPEPDRAAIPLDLFPSLILDNLNIVKTFTPDMPADFAGGSVRVQTRELPSKPLLQASLGLGFDDQSTFRKRLAQRGSDTDFLGFDSGMRALPDRLKDRVLNDVPQDEQALAAREVNAYMSSKRYRSLPNYSLSAVAGNGWALPKDQRLGALITFNYGRSYTVRDDGILRSFVFGSRPDGTGRVLRKANDYSQEIGNDRVSWGSLASVSYWPAQHHRLSLLGLHTQLADSTAQFVEGRSEGRGAQIANTRLKYVSRALNFVQLRGDHDLPALANAHIDWNAAISHANRAEPDTRDTVFQAGEGGGDYFSIPTPENGAHLFADQGETSVGGGLDWTQPFTRNADSSKFKVGGLVSHKSRDFKARRLHFAEIGVQPYSCGPRFYASCPDGLYLASNVGTELEGARLGLLEDTRSEDAYKATLDVYAGYGQLELALGKDVRVLGGARVEATQQSIDPYTQYRDQKDPPGASIDSVDVLPALSVVYSATKKAKFRASAARTLARPQIRELAPFEYADYFGARAYKGDPNLKLTYIDNGDLRFEYFPTQKEVLAFSLFYKHFEYPIENIVVNSGDGVIRPQNARGGRLVGLELEARQSLEFLLKDLKDFSVIANLTLAKSWVELNVDDPTVQVTNSNRAMVNQAPYVLNLAADYSNEASGTSARVLYNVSGKRIVEVGTDDLPDVYEQPKHAIDLTVSQSLGKHWQLKLAGANLLGSQATFTLGPRRNDERIVQRYTESRVFSLSGTYTY